VCSHKLFGKVLIDLFQKVAGVGGAHENGVSFLQAFFFAPPSCKEKSDYES
jgi:hypothetical protein